MNKLVPSMQLTNDLVIGPIPDLDVGQIPSLHPTFAWGLQDNNRW